MQFVYFVYDNLTNFVKIGIAKNVKRRIAQLQTSHGNTLILLGWIESGNARMLEKELHCQFCDSRINLSEWFELSNNIITYINDNSQSGKHVKRIGNEIYVLSKMKIVN